MAFGSLDSAGTPFAQLMRRREEAFAQADTSGGEGVSAIDHARNHAFGKPDGQVQPDAFRYGQNDTSFPLPSMIVSNDAADRADGREPAPIKSSLRFTDFASNPAYDKFKLADAQMSQQFNPDGTTNISYTAKDFSTCKMFSRADGSYGIAVADKYGRPQRTEDIDQNGSTLALYTYQDTNGRTSPWAASKSLKYANGTGETVTYDKFGRMSSKVPTSEIV